MGPRCHAAQAQRREGHERMVDRADAGEAATRMFRTLREREEYEEEQAERQRDDNGP